MVAKDDPVTCTIYARENNSLDNTGWKISKTIAKRKKKMLHMVNQAKQRSYHYTPKYKFGLCIPMNYEQALKLNERNNNYNWRDCTRLEATQLTEYEIFTDLKKDGKPP